MNKKSKTYYNTNSTQCQIQYYNTDLTQCQATSKEYITIYIWHNVKKVTGQHIKTHSWHKVKKDL